MYAHELIALLQKYAAVVDGEMSDVKVNFYVGAYDYQDVCSLELVDVGFDFGPEGSFVTVDVVLDENDFSNAHNAMQVYMNAKAD